MATTASTTGVTTPQFSSGISTLTSGSSTYTVPTISSGLGITSAVNTSSGGSCLHVNGPGSVAAARIGTDGKMELNGSSADLVINGTSLSQSLQQIQERLNILQSNPKLEDTWSELAEAGRRYREIEAKLLEREKILDILES